MYREYFPGYCGHIPYKYEVIGKTVGATNYHIKSLLTKEPDYSQTYIPSINKDYTYYKKDYFNSDFAKGYELEEDKIFGMRSKEARTWINGNKHQLYPEHIPGYTGHLTGIEPAGKKGCPIFGSSYAKSSAISIKGNFNKEIDVRVVNDHGYAVIDFVDNGCGLASEYKNNPEIIFNAFETSIVDSKNNKIGTGMGLFIAKGVIDKFKDSTITLLPVDKGFGIRTILKLIL